MNIADVKIDQELVYRSRYFRGEYGPHIRVTSIDELQITGIVLHPMNGPWPMDSQFLGLAEDFCLPVEVPDHWDAIRAQKL